MNGHVKSPEGLGVEAMLLQLALHYKPLSGPASMLASLSLLSMA